MTEIKEMIANDDLHKIQDLVIEMGGQEALNDVLVQKIDDLQKQVSYLRDAKIKQMQTDSKRLWERVKGLKALGDELQGLESHKIYEKALEDAKRIHERYEVVWLKECVATSAECAARLQEGVPAQEALENAGTVARIALRCFDNCPDWWWMKHAERKVWDWVETFLRYSEEGLPEFEDRSDANEVTDED